MIVTNNKKEFRFEIQLPGDEVAYLQYRWLKGDMVLLHTVVPASSRKSGIGSILVKQVLDYVRQAGLKVVIYCPFVAKYVREHPEYDDLKSGG